MHLGFVRRGFDFHAEDRSTLHRLYILKTTFDFIQTLHLCISALCAVVLNFRPVPTAALKLVIFTLMRNH